MGIGEITDISLNIQGKLINPYVDKLNSDKMPYMNNFRVNIRLKSILSITPCKKCCNLKSISSI